MTNDVVLYACMVGVLIAIFYPNDDATGQLGFFQLFINTMVASLSDITILPIPVLCLAAAFLTFKKSKSPTIAVLAILMVSIIRLQSVYYVDPMTPTGIDWACLYVMYISAAVAILSVYLKGRIQ